MVYIFFHRKPERRGVNREGVGGERDTVDLEVGCRTKYVFARLFGKRSTPLTRLLMTTLPIETEEQRQDACTPAAQKLCRSCKFPMPVDANKCTKCSSLQNWRRYLDNSSIVLSLLVAL